MAGEGGGEAVRAREGEGMIVTLLGLIAKDSDCVNVVFCSCEVLFQHVLASPLSITSSD